MVGRTKDRRTLMNKLARQCWGKINHQRKVTDGVVFYDCASHGGYVVDTKLYPKTKEFKTIVNTRKNSGKYYPSNQHFATFEEDCAWVVLFHLYPELIPKALRRLEHLMVGNYSEKEFKELVRKKMERSFPERLKDNRE